MPPPPIELLGRGLYLQEGKIIALSARLFASYYRISRRNDIMAWKVHYGDVTKHNELDVCL